MKEIGGYIELEHYTGPMLHERGILLNCGRNCLAYLIQARKIYKLAMPYFMCDSVLDLCKKYHISVRFYHIGWDFQPCDFQPADDEWLYLTNYYGQLTKQMIKQWKDICPRLIVDNAQAYFDEPVPGIDTIYTCRKFFGVPDGAVLFSDARLQEEPARSESMMYCDFLLGRFEQNASAYYARSQENNQRFVNAPIQSMSRLTENLLRSIDYDKAKSTRTENFNYLDKHLSGYNLLSLHQVEGGFAYPFLIDNGAQLRKELIKEKIYVPTLWPNVIRDTSPDFLEYRFAADLLPLPCDHRYGTQEMEIICHHIETFMRRR